MRPPQAGVIIEKSMLILASASPRRKQILGEIVTQFDIIPATGEEDAQGATAPDEVVKVLARQKAREVASLPKARGKAVLGADTVVALDGEILGKPKNEADAYRMLSALSGKTHEVYTGVCLISADGTERVEADCTRVRFYKLTDEQIYAYIRTGSPMDKAGAYGIQDGGLVEKIEGSFTNVVGLPKELCEKMLGAGMR